MNRILPRTVAFAVISASALLSTASLPALAQDTGSTMEIYEIIVTAPRVQVQETRRPMGGSAVSMSYAVGYADLDLSRTENRTELEARVREAAEEICLLLSERYASGAGTAACVRQAMRDAMPQVERAIAASAE